MSAGASDFWRWLKGASGKGTPGPVLIDDEAEDESVVSVATIDVSRTTVPAPASRNAPDPTSDNLQRARRAASSQEPANAADAPGLMDWDTGEDVAVSVAAPKNSADENPVLNAPLKGEYSEPAGTLAEAQAGQDAGAVSDSAPEERAETSPIAQPTPHLAPAPTYEDPLPYRLRVLSGLHEGAELELDDGVITIGGLEAAHGAEGDTPPADLTLADLANAHQITLEAGQLRAPDDDTPRQLPCEIEVEGVRLWIESVWGDAEELLGSEIAEEAPPAAKSSVAGPVGATVAGLALSLAILGATLPIVSEPPAPLPAASAFVADAEFGSIAERIAAIAPAVRVSRRGEGLAFEGPVAEKAAAGLTSAIEEIGLRYDVDPSGVATSADAASALARRLASGGLADALTIRRDGDALSVSGALSEDQGRFWSDVERWFESRYGPTITLTETIALDRPENAAAPRIGLQAVWVGRDPYLIAADGRRSRPGDKLPGGWRIVEISPERVRLSREGAIHDIQLAAAPAPSAVQAELRQTEAPR